MNDHVRTLANSFAERMKLSVAPDPDVQLEQAFRISPNPQPLSLENGELPLGSLQTVRPIQVLLQLQMPPQMDLNYRTVARLVGYGDVLKNRQQACQSISDLSLEVVEELGETEPPPNSIVDALRKLSMYQMQERAREALERGNVTEATRRLENLATRLLAEGESELATQVLAEARRVAHTSGISDKGRMTIKYQTRHLLLPSGDDDAE
jgi:Ca-activated chloride channel family protein